MIRELDPRVASAKRMVAELAGVSPDEIVLTRNSTESLEIAEFGLNLKAGDEVITTNQDYPHMLTAYQQRERRDGIKLTQLSFPVPVTSPDDLYNMFEKAVTPQTKVIHFWPHHHRTGVIFPVRRICDMAAARGITTVIDGAHAFSQFPFKFRISTAIITESACTSGRSRRSAPVFFTCENRVSKRHGRCWPRLPGRTIRSVSLKTSARIRRPTFLRSARRSRSIRTLGWTARRSGCAISGSAGPISWRRIRK